MKLPPRKQLEGRGASAWERPVLDAGTSRVAYTWGDVEDALAQIASGQLIQEILLAGDLSVTRTLELTEAHSGIRIQGLAAAELVDEIPFSVADRHFFNLNGCERVSFGNFSVKAQLGTEVLFNAGQEVKDSFFERILLTGDNGVAVAKGEFSNCLFSLVSDVVSSGASGFDSFQPDICTFQACINLNMTTGGSGSFNSFVGGYWFSLTTTSTENDLVFSGVGSGSHHATDTVISGLLVQLQDSGVAGALVARAAAGATNVVGN